MRYTTHCIWTLLFTLSAHVANAQLTAGFTANHYSGCAPLLVAFTNTTTPSSGTTYVWSLGNGSGPDTLTNPATSYITAGTYTVTLTATHGSSTSTATAVITVYPSPVVSFYATDTVVCPGVSSTYISTSSPGVPGAATYTWSFGDGYTATGTPVTHAIALPGHFNISLTVTNADGCSTLLTKPGYIDVLTPPVPVFSVTATHICPGTGVTFTSLPSGVGPYTYYWRFGDGTPTSAFSNPNHVYTSPGSYNVTFAVTDSRGCEDSTTMPAYITVSNMVTSFTGPDTVCTKTLVSFTNTSTNYLTYEWLFGDGDTSTVSSRHIYDTTGSFTVRLVTYNGYCHDTVAHSLYIPPPASSFTVTPAHPCPAPETQVFKATVPAGATVTWSFGDSVLGSGTNVSHTYTKDKYDTVQMFVTYSVGCKDTVTWTDSIYDLIFTEYNSDPLGGCAPVTTTFSTLALTSLPPSYPPPLPPYPYPYGISYSWDFGDGSPHGSGSPVSHTYTAVGTFPVTLTYTTANGCVFYYHDTARAGKPPVATFTATPLHKCYKDNEISFTRTLVSGPANAYYWLFGEGNYFGGMYDTVSLSVFTVVHHFVLPGLFSDTLISFYNGCPDTFIRHDYVQIDSPMSVAEEDYICSPPREVRFKNFSLGDNTHTFYFGDGYSSTLDTVVHTYASPGVYMGMLTTYNTASTCRDTDYIYIDLTKLVFNFSTPDSAICRDNSVTLTSTVTSGYTSYYTWLAAGTHRNDTSGPVMIDTFYHTGRYTVTLVVLDQHLCPDTMTRPNYILVAKPVARFTVSPSYACFPNPTTLTDVSTDQPGTFFTRYNWAFGDSTSAIVTSPSVTHTFTSVGTYTTTEIVTDNIGCKDTITSALVSVAHPRASFTMSTNHSCAYRSVIFTNTSTPAGATFRWLFGDGNTSLLTSPTHSYTDTGHFTVTMIMTDPHGCTDTARNTIRITRPYSKFTLDDSVAICPPFTVNFTDMSTGALTYLWDFGNGNHSNAVSPSNLYTDPGFDTVMLVTTDTAGCTDTATAHVKIYGYAGAFSYTPDSSCVPATIVFNADLSNVSLASSIVWDFSDGTIITVTGTIRDTISHTYRLPGGYLPKLIIADSNCSSPNPGLDTIRVDGVNPGFKALPNPACPNDTVRLADTSSSYWSRITGRTWIANGTTDTTNSPRIIYAASGLYADTLHVKDAWGCAATAVSIVTVNPLPNAGTITSNVVNTFCLGLQFEVQDTASNGAWSLSNSHIRLSGDTVTAITPGIDTLYYTVTNSCGTAIAMDTFTVPPPLPLITGKLAVCVGDTAILRDSVVGGMWQDGSPHAILYSNVLDSGILVGVSAGTVTVTYQIDLGCNTTAQVTVNPLPDVTSTIAPIKCYGDSDGSVTLVPVTGSSPYQYHWSNGATAPAVHALQAGAYSVIVGDTILRCVLRDTFQITMPDSIVIVDSINSDVCFSPNGSISVTPSGGTSPYTYLWSTNASGNEVIGLKSGPYTLTLTDANGCIKNYSFLLTDTGCPYIVIYNAISPNGDGINDTWVIEHIQNFPGNTVKVFDKWGDEIFSASDYKNDWYGIGKDGKLVPDGTYYYLVKLNSNKLEGEKGVFTGALLIKH